MDSLNKNRLSERKADFLNGYDNAIEDILTLFDNLEVYPELHELLDDNKAVILEGKAEIAREVVADWAEMRRDELIAGFIDDYKEQVDGQSTTENE